MLGITSHVCKSVPVLALDCIDECVETLPRGGGPRKSSVVTAVTHFENSRISKFGVCFCKRFELSVAVERLQRLERARLLGELGILRTISRIRADAKFRDRVANIRRILPTKILRPLLCAAAIETLLTDRAGQTPPDCGKKFSSHRPIVDGTVLTH
jgi:hypothetical protein